MNQSREITGTRIEVASRRVKIEQVQIIHDHYLMRAKRVEDKAVKRFLERERVRFCRRFDEILHVQENPAGLLMQLLQDRRLTAPNSAPKSEN